MHSPQNVKMLLQRLSATFLVLSGTECGVFIRVRSARYSCHILKKLGLYGQI